MHRFGRPVRTPPVHIAGDCVTIDAQLNRCSSPRLPSGEMVMVTAKVRWLAVLAVLGTAWLVAPVPAAEDDAALRDKILELNKLTGTEPIEGEVRSLIGDP